jgi:TorA maturation chaperone TorD
LQTLDNLLELIDEITIYFHYPSKELVQDSGSCDIEELESEYIRLFVNDFDEPIISLYVSSYIKDIPPQEIISHLKKLYITAGLNINPEVKEREDHILFCFQFLYLLLYNHIEKKLVENFSKNFIFPFMEVPELIYNKTEHPYFINAADSLNNFFDILEDWLIHRLDYE